MISKAGVLRTQREDILLTRMLEDTESLITVARALWSRIQGRLIAALSLVPTVGRAG